jgi:hypothetical protein
MERAGFTVLYDPGSCTSIRLLTAEDVINEIKTFREECFEDEHLDGASVSLPTKEQLEALTFGEVYVFYDNYFHVDDPPFYCHVVAYATGVYKTAI